MLVHFVLIFNALILVSVYGKTIKIKDDGELSSSASKTSPRHQSEHESIGAVLESSIGNDESQPTPIENSSPSHTHAPTKPFIRPDSSNDRKNLLKFFNATSIHKEVGLYSETQKKYAADGYNAQWDFFHFHHVCIRGGGDGIYTGMLQGTKDVQISEQNSLSLDDWNEFVRMEEASPLLSRTLDSKGRHKSKLIRGSTILLNCFREGTQSTKAAKFMSKMVLAYARHNAIPFSLTRSLLSRPLPSKSS